MKFNVKKNVIPFFLRESTRTRSKMFLSASSMFFFFFFFNISAIYFSKVSVQFHFILHRRVQIGPRYLPETEEKFYETALAIFELLDLMKYARYKMGGGGGVEEF